MTRTPQHVFDLPLDLFANVLEAPGVAGALGPVRPETGFYAHWPQQEHWAPYVARLAAATRHLLHVDERRAIEAKLTAVEKSLDEHLSAADAAGARRGAAALLDTLNELEELICRPRAHAHATHPYLVRWCSLHAAVLYVVFTAGGGQDDVDVPERFVHMWRSARGYLQHARQAARAERVGQIRLALTGALRDKVFIHDDREGALTVEVPVGGGEEEELRRVLALLQNEAAARYFDELALAESVEIIDRGPLGVVVSPKSPAKREHFIEAANVYWRAPQAALVAEIEGERSACGDALARLGTESLRRLREPEAAARAIGTGTDVVFDILEAMNGLIGLVPVVGTPISAVTGLFLKWARPSDGDPWTKFEDSMKRYVRKVVEEIYGTNMKAALGGFDERYDDFLKNYETYLKNPNGGFGTLSDYQKRAGDLFEQINAHKWFFFTTGSYHGTVPFFEHYFLLNVAANVAAQKTGEPTRPYAQKRRELYQDTQNYLRQAIRGLAAERAEDLAHKYDSCESKPYNFDHRTNQRVSDKYEVDHREEKCNFTYYTGQLLPLSKAAAGLVSAAQLMRLAVKNVIKVIEADKEAGFSASLIAETYRQEMSTLYRNMWGKWAARGWTYTGKHYHSMSGSGATIQYRDYTHKWDEVWGKLHQDHEALINLGESYFTQYHVRPPSTIFDITGGRAEEGTNVALRKPASQSSTHEHGLKPTADKAVDGNVSGDFNNGSVTHTCGCQTPNDKKVRKSARRVWREVAGHCLTPSISPELRGWTVPVIAGRAA